jgi:hypothetical protein
MTACFSTFSVPHPFAFFLAKGCETENPQVRNHAVKDLEANENGPTDFLRQQIVSEVRRIFDGTRRRSRGFRKWEGLFAHPFFKPIGWFGQPLC